MFPNFNSNNQNEFIESKINPDVFKELWNNRKEQQKWLIAFAAGLVFFVLITFIVLMLRVIFIDDTVQAFSNYIKRQQTGDNPVEIVRIKSDYVNNFIILGVAVFIFSVVALVSFTLGWKKSESFESYHLLSPWAYRAIVIILIVDAISFIPHIFGNSVLTYVNGISILFNQAKDNNILGHIPEIINIISIILLFLFWIILGRTYNNIKKTYLSVYITEQKRIFEEEMRKSFSQNDFNNNPFVNSPSFQEFMKRNQNRQPNNSFGATNKNQQQSNQNNQNNNNNKIAHSKEYEEKLSQLYILSRAQLNKIASKLNIFGYEDFTKEELSKKIISITDPDLT